mmetsp:Transcript_8214/g.16930  ORF Transcript_8214/g.16930 Transcript_8214/m.16930 type:complete len:236 (+) Transcript_8214:348-1055(+)
MMADLSPLNSTCPCFASFTALVMSVVSVPSLGLGMRPRGPRMRATCDSWGIKDGCPIARSKLIAPLPPLFIFAMSSSAPTTSAPAASASSASAPRAKTATRVFLPVPLGRTARPRTIWSLRLGSTPSWIAISTVSSNLAFELSLTSRRASLRRSSCFGGLRTKNGSGGGTAGGAGILLATSDGAVIFPGRRCGSAAGITTALPLGISHSLVTISSSDDTFGPSGSSASVENGLYA